MPHSLEVVVGKERRLWLACLPTVWLSKSAPPATDFVCVCVCAPSFRSCLKLWDPMDCSPQSSSVHGISQASILEWVAISFPRESFGPRDQTCIGRWILYRWATWETPNQNIYKSLYKVKYMPKKSLSTWLLLGTKFRLNSGCPIKFECHLVQQITVWE